MSVVITENENQVATELGKLVKEISDASIKERDAFYVGVSGGSIIKFLATGLSQIQTDFSKWTIFFNDERVVPIDDPESTFGSYKKDLIGKVPLEEAQFVQIKQGVSAAEAAADYIQQMASYFPADSLPRFDLLLLGMGPDGHTCSLFPNHELLSEESVWVAPITDSPKPPPARITLTLPVLNNARNCVFAMAGEGKAEMVKRVLEDKEDLPVNRVKLTSGRIYWILDKAAGKHLKS